MKAKYLVQVKANLSGWVTVEGAMTKKAAAVLNQDFIDAGASQTRVISADDFSKEHRAANHAAMNAALKGN